MFKFHLPRLQTKIVILLVVVTLLPLATLGLWGAYSIKEARRQNVAELEWQLANQQAFQLKKFIDDRLENFDVRVANEIVEDIDLPQQRYILSAMLNKDAALMEVAFIGTHLTSISQEGIEMTHFVSPNKELPPEEVSKFNHLKDEAYLKANSGKKYFGQITFDTRGVPKAVFASPVVNQQGKVIAVLWGRLELASLQNQFLRVQLGSSGYVYALTDKGEVLAHSGAFSASKKGFKVPDLASSVLSGKVRRGLQPEDSYINYEGKTVLATGLPIPSLNWAVVAEWPEDEAMAPVQGLVNSLLIVSLVTLLLVLSLSFVAANALLKPMRQLQLGANIIGQGNFKHRIFLNTHDELSDLAASFNQMAKDLEALEELKEMRIRNQALAESLAKEKELSQMKDTFISVSSHQLRTPLSSLKWSLELLQGEKLSPENSELLKGSVSNANQLSAMVEDLLLVSEFGLGYKAKAVESFDLSALLGSELETIKPQIKAKALKLNASLPTQVLIKGDERAVKIALHNLLDNAVTYTKAGNISVALEPLPHDIILRIQDTGIGIPAGEQASLGQQFFRATNSIDQKNVGTGLGLFLAKTIIEGHGGKLAITSEPNKGASLTITLPLTAVI